MYLRLLVTSFVTAAALSGAASAQARGAGVFSHPPSVTPGFAGFGVTSTTGFGPTFLRHPLGNTPVVFLPALEYEPAPIQPLSVVVVQPAGPAAAPREEEPRPPAKPLLLELQGDHWVQVEHFEMSSNIVHNRYQQSVERSDNPSVDTLLVFRDGRSERTSAYAVIGDSLFEQSNYWMSGSWTRKIPIADLDLPATIKANQRRGVIFRLPAGPNEIVLQP